MDAVLALLMFAAEWGLTLLEFVLSLVLWLVGREKR
jgi:hypothetical protein